MSRAPRTPQTSSGLPGCPRLRPNPSRRWSARPGVSARRLEPAPAPVHGSGDRDADKTTYVGAMQSADETVVEEVWRRDQVAEQVVVVDEEQARGGTREPRDERQSRARPAFEDEEAEKNDGGPRWRPEVRQDQEVLIRNVQIAHEHRICRERGAEDSASQRRLPSLQ